MSKFIFLVEHFFFYWSLSLFSMFIDILYFNNWFKIKIYQPYIIDTLKNIFKTVLINQIISVPIFLFFNFETSNSFRFIQIFYFLLFIIVYDFFFYHIHIVFHLNFFYTKFHKYHEKWVDPIGISVFYSHPVEHIFLNVLPFLLSAKICLLNLSFLRVLQFIFLFYSIFISHGGFKIPYYSNFHIYHHNKQNCNFGIFGIFDKLYNTAI